MEHVVAPRYVVARQYIANDVVFEVANMQVTTGVGEHFEDVAAGGTGPTPGIEYALFFPKFAPFGFDCGIETIAFAVRHTWPP